MLTKDLLKYTIRADKIFPKYLKPTDRAFTSLASELEGFYARSIGRRYRELGEDLKQSPQAGETVFQGFCKLLEDRCTFSGVDLEVEEQRWNWMLKARALRQETYSSYAEFQGAVSQSLGISLLEIQDRLYGDLEENKVMISFEPLGGERLVHRYNLAQIQGLLLRAVRVRVKVRSADLLERRRLLQRLRFCHLLAEFSEEENELSLELSGPLALFEQTQSYGMRLCRFFPYIVLFDQWTLEADIRIGEKSLSLSLDDSRPIRSHYRSFTGHIPEEFKELISAFNQLSEAERKGWTVEIGSECLNLGQQNYCVPDMSFRHPAGAVRHLEIFHRWHKAELLRRLEGLGLEQNENFFFGVSKDISKDSDLEARLAKFQERDISIFTFRQFPSLKAILTYLAKVKVPIAVL